MGPATYPLSMENLAEMLKNKRAEILEIARRNGATSVRVFGSVARGESGADSDLDLLVELEKGRSLFDLAGIVVGLEELLGRKVDVLTPAALHHTFRDEVLAEAIDL